MVFLPDLQKVIPLLNKKSTFRDIYDTISSVEAHPIDDTEKYWLKQSVLNYAMLFIDDEILLTPETEQDLLGNIFGFIKNKLLSGTKAYGAKQSHSSSESKNSSRSIGSMNKVVKKQLAENADLDFRHLSHEPFCLEIGLKDGGPNGTKERNESSLKTPVMMKNFCSGLITQYDMNPDNIKFMAIIISGLSIKTLGMSFNHGSVSLLSVSKRLHLPEGVSKIPRLLPPILNLVYNVSRLLKSTVDQLKDKNSSVVIEPETKFFLPPCFVPVANATTNKKRKPNQDQ